MRIAVIGNGLLGRTLFDLAMPDESEPGALVMTGHSDYDITEPSDIDALLSAHRPDVVVNTAAYHRLGECEADPAMAYLVNEIGAENVASRVRTIYVSTDYVFTDGGPHDEDLPGRRPRSVYGRSKLAGELATLKHGGIVVRVSALFGHHPSHKGPTFPEMVLSDHAPLRLPNDQRFAPTYAPDAAARILDLALDPKAQGIYHAANKGDVSWAEWAEEIATYVGHKRHVTPYKAKDPLRPGNSVLKSTRLPQLPHWKDALGRWAQREGHYQVVSPKRA